MLLSDIFGSSVGIVYHFQASVTADVSDTSAVDFSMEDSSDHKPRFHGVFFNFQDSKYNFSSLEL
jgi:hypothetical protein